MSTPRKSKQFWAVDNDQVRKVTGWACPPNKYIWWCPELGWSGTEGIHLFKKEKDALSVAIEDAEKALNRIKITLTDLKRRQAKMP
jgi:hypothetical protein